MSHQSSLYSARWHRYSEHSPDSSSCSSTSASIRLPRHSLRRPVLAVRRPLSACRRLLAALLARYQAWLLSTPRRSLDAWAKAIESELAARPWYGARLAPRYECRYCEWEASSVFDSGMAM